MSSILLAGGAGYLGSHTAVELLNAGFDVVVTDNYSNSCPEVIKRVERLTDKTVALYEADVCDGHAMRNIMKRHTVDCVIHFAGLKAVGESMAKPISYYRNNIDTTLTLLEAMQDCDVKNIIFSSSATVYGEENIPPFLETMRKGSCTNPYAWTKSMIEQIFQDTAVANPELSVVLLRYFNPVGAHPSGLIGEDPHGIPNNLMPYVTQVAVGRRDHLSIFGNDYPTPDGTCRRDFIHVVDLAIGHVRAVEYARVHKGLEIFNLGTGTPYSVREIVETFQRINNVTVRYEFGPRRPGDVAECWADVKKAATVLGWKAERNLEDMCRDSWHWQQMNPQGYERR